MASLSCLTRWPRPAPDAPLCDTCTTAPTTNGLTDGELAAARTELTKLCQGADARADRQRVVHALLVGYLGDGRRWVIGKPSAYGLRKAAAWYAMHDR